VFRCGDQVCRSAPDGKLRTTLTSDGGYTWVSASADGARLGVVHDGAAYVLDGEGGFVAGALPRSAVVTAAQLSPDGSQIATIEGGTSFSMNFKGSGRTALAPSAGGVGWLGARLLSSDGTATCLLAGTTCERVVGGGASPAASADGHLVAGARGGIALFDAGTGALARQLTTGAADSAPTFSPDGSLVAFSRGNEIFVTAATAAPGAEKSVVKNGRQPVWVSGGAACRETLTAKPKAKDKRIEATACAPGAGTLTVTLVTGEHRLARKKVKTKLGGLVTVSFKKPATQAKLRVTVRFQDAG